MSLALKSLFLLDPEVVYLNHGSYGACPAPVFAEYQHWQRELEREPDDLLAALPRHELQALRDARRLHVLDAGVQVLDVLADDVEVELQAGGEGRHGDEPRGVDHLEQQAGAVAAAVAPGHA